MFQSEGPEERELRQVANVYFQQLNGMVNVTPRFWTS